MRDAINAGLIPLERLDEAVRTVLRFKEELGLFRAPFARRELLPRVRCAEHLALARRAVRKSLVCLRNEGGLLPLRRAALRCLHVSGRAANDMGLQCGGWTASWQGARGPITDGTTILEALRAELPGVDVEFAEGGRGVKAGRHDVAICCVAEEKPYAEWFGDVRDLNLAGDAQILRRVVGKGVPVVLVVVSARPLVCDLQGVGALVMAWLPGSEGGGVVDGLFGRIDGRMPLGLPGAMEATQEHRALFAAGAGIEVGEAV